MEGRKGEGGGRRGGGMGRREGEREGGGREGGGGGGGREEGWGEEKVEGGRDRIKQICIFMTESERERETEWGGGGEGRRGGAKVSHSGLRLVLRVFVSIPQHVVEPPSLCLVQCPQLHPAAHLHNIHTCDVMYVAVHDAGTNRIIIPSERASQEEQNDANFSFVAPSSEEL